MDYTNFQYDITPTEQSSDIIILHERLTGRREDRYMTNFAQCLEAAGFQVTIMAVEVDDEAYALDDIKLSANIKILKRVQWIPRHIFGFLRSVFRTYRSLCLALSAVFHRPSEKPCVVIMDLDLIGLFTLKMLTNHKVFHVEQFRSYRNPGMTNPYLMLPNLFEAKWMKMADEIIIESPALMRVFNLTYPCLNREPKILIPLIDIGLWTEPGINIKRIIPDINNSCILFVALGKFRRNSNFQLAVESFGHMLETVEDPCFKERAHLVIGGNCKFWEEKRFCDMFVESLQRRWFACRVTVLRQLPTIHAKTLLLEACVVLHTALNDICSDYLLQAMSVGKPIIAANTGIAAKLLENRITGMLVEPQAAYVAAAMIKVAVSYNIQVFLGGMALDAFRHKFSMDSFTRKICGMVKRSVEPVGPSATLPVDEPL